MLAERGADAGGGAVPIVGQRLDDDGAAAGAIAFVANLFVVLVVASSGLVDCALDIVLGHGLPLGGVNRQTQTRVHVGVGRAHFRGHGDLAAQLGKQVGPFLVLRTFAVHDVFKLGMACHRICAPIRKRKSLGRCQ